MSIKRRGIIELCNSNDCQDILPIENIYIEIEDEVTTCIIISYEDKDGFHRTVSQPTGLSKDVRDTKMKAFGLFIIYVLTSFSGCFSIVLWGGLESLDKETIGNCLFVISLLQIITFPILVIYNNKYLR